MIIKTKDPKKGKMVTAGEIHRNNFYRKIGPKHYMIKENGYGVQVDVLETLAAAGVEEIVLVAKKTVFRIPLYIWVTKGHKKDYGSGMQVFLDKKWYQASRLVPGEFK